MNMRCGSYQNPQENPDFWVPSTPEKPASQRSSNAPPEMARSGTENWNELLGIYSGFLQNEPSNAAARAHIDQQEGQVSNTIRLMGQNYSNANARDVSRAVSGDGLGFLGPNITDRNARGALSTDNGRILNQRGNNVFYGNRRPQPQRVDSLVDLLSSKSSAVHYHPVSGVAPSTSHVSNYVVSGPTTGLTASQLMSYVSNGSHANRETPNDRLMISYWPNNNLRLLPSIAATSSPSMASPFVPITPGQHNLKLSSTTAPLDTSSPPPPPSEKEGEEILEIDLNKTPQQKTPKRRKIRPKVVVEGKKPRRSPNKEKKTPPPKENPRPKRKYVRRKAVEEPPAPPPNAVQDLNAGPGLGPPVKSIRRLLNFDLNVEAEKEGHRGGGDHRETQVLVGSNLLSGQEKVKVAAFEPRGSPPSGFTIPQQLAPKNHALVNIIARSLNAQSTGVSIYNHASNGEPPLQVAREFDVIEERGPVKGQRQVHDLPRVTNQQPCNDDVTVLAESSVMYRNVGFTCEGDRGQRSCRDKNGESSGPVRSWCPSSSSQVRSTGEQMGKNVNSIIAEPSARNEIAIFSDRVAVKKRLKKVALMDKPGKKATGRRKANSSKEGFRWEEKSHSISIDFITDRLRALQIGLSGKELVPYGGGDGAIVPFEPAKKRVPRPRVELDSETNRLWNLLMGKEGTENNADAMDNDKQRWWDEERKVVRGRVDSFIARMHLVQGDRRFSKWKGSVVDSVIGVFLTQNVSDHLSSSAFMSLVSKFPAKSTKTSSKKHEVVITHPEETSNHPASNSSLTSVESSEQGTGKTVLNQTTSSNKHASSLQEEDIVSSQGSTESCTIQNVEDVRSLSGSNSEAEVIDSQRSDHQFRFNVSSFPGNSMLHLGAFVSDNTYHQNSAPFVNSWTKLLLGLQNLEPNVPTLDTAELINGREGVEHASKNIESSDLGTQSHQQELNNWDFTNRNEGGIHVKDFASATKPAEGSPKSDNQQNEAGGVNSSCSPPDKNGDANTNTRKRKAEKKEKAEPIDWDTLRTKAEADIGVRGRTYENMDSLDYEALRNADVREISDTIKERGMNNMLAERIKDFLNRLERDHGKVDLEWLRDVPPDKSKDYLLSIRGLGLKSVECVRLLTLHHLAFPVDTNVGRISVRLGWVPLQPLPESLQLHLLELYPVLETIQKYLWPRLCKLDQEILYELHYQMITFGKVFCTKRDPNCNACPMRAECRHFASAFASARLTLPAPEDKRIVSSAGPIGTDDKGGPVELPKPMLLTPVEDSSETRTGFSRECEPLIEEPTTPEQPVEFEERDIEDFYYEDPDEIPVIKLNVEEFANNLQNFMQEKMEIGEADVSKALVALSPTLASIPVPKLKSISRLRTEHQVYQLPDSHPLLKEMERREPDDPSPYLLAIWTPGETADSVTAPEIACSSRGGGGACDGEACFSCSSAQEAQAQTVRGTILIPCRTAMRGSFPLNGTYFQVNEVFADHDSSLNPIDVPRSLLWNLPRRTVFFGTSVTTIFKGMSTEEIQICFWKGFVCVRGFDQKTRAPRPLRARLHFPASKTAKKNE